MSTPTPGRDTAVLLHALPRLGVVMPARPPRSPGALLASHVFVLLIAWVGWRLWLWPLSQRPEPAAAPAYGWPALAALLLWSAAVYAKGWSDARASAR